MRLKIWPLVLASLLIVAISGIAYGIPAVVEQGTTSDEQYVPYAQDISFNLVADHTYRTLDWITIKRIYPKIDNVGHYWIEMSDGNGNTESYGWYPITDNGLALVFGAQGYVNAGDPRRDPMQGDNADVEFHPVTAITLTNEEIRESIRNFAANYRGDWALFTRNCQTFQKELMASIGLEEPITPDGRVLDPDYTPTEPSTPNTPSWQEVNPSDDDSSVGQDVNPIAIESSPSSIQSSSIQQESTGTGMSNEEVGQQVSETVGSIFEAGAAGMIDHTDASVGETIQAFQGMIPTHD